ncbi:MAG: LysR family transcriptional regulator [Rhodobacteraceae bacterium]|nr:LysR family transcriptional regulator [Paracoccaceae bacterium]
MVRGETGAFGTTARHLAPPQPALMRRTLKLEDALGLRLFDRTTDSLSPTRAEAPGRNSAISPTAQQSPARTAASSGERASKRISVPGTGDAAEIPGTAATVRRVNRGPRRTWDSRKNGRLTSTKNTLAEDLAQRPHVGRRTKAFLRGMGEGRRALRDAGASGVFSRGQLGGEAVGVDAHHATRFAGRRASNPSSGCPATICASRAAVVGPRVKP